MTTPRPNPHGAEHHAQERAGESAEAETELLAAIVRHLQTQTGQDFSPYKTATLWRRIRRRMAVVGSHDVAAYLTQLHNDPAEVTALLRACLIAVTGFFRDPEAFAALAHTIIPQILRNKGADEHVRVWVVGCATGEEAYSVAMLLQEAMTDQPTPTPIQIFATDLDEENLAFARRGLYPVPLVESVGATRLQRFFHKEKTGYRIKTELRNQVLFAVHNLLHDPPFANLDLICCRNVLIYLAEETQGRLFERFHDALRPLGYLFLGAAESAERAAKLFTPVLPTESHRHHFYQRRPGRRRLRRLAAPARTVRPVRTPPPVTSRSPHSARPVQDLYQAWTLRHYAPPRLLVNGAYEITHIFNGAGRYLREPDGVTTQNILQKVIPSLRLELHPALYQAFATGERTESRLLSVQVEDEPCFVQLQVGPVAEVDFPQELIEVVIAEHKATLVNRLASALSLTPAAEQEWARHMEADLQRTQERLQTTLQAHESALQQLRVANEQLQLANEELQLTAEELATSQEALQVLNEELLMVNRELTRQLDVINGQETRFLYPE